MGRLGAQWLADFQAPRFAPAAAQARAPFAVATIEDEDAGAIRQAQHVDKIIRLVAVEQTVLPATKLVERRNRRVEVKS